MGTTGEIVEREVCQRRAGRVRRDVRRRIREMYEAAQAIERQAAQRRSLVWSTGEPAAFDVATGSHLGERLRAFAV